MSLELSWQRVRWEVLTNPFEVNDPFFHLNVRRFELTPEPPALDLADYRPGSWLDLTLLRGDRVRRQRALELRDYLLLVAALTLRHEALHETGVVSADAQAVEWVQPAPSRPVLGREHRWWLSVDVSNCFESMDYRRLVRELRLPPSWRRAVLRLLQEHRAGPRQGVMSVGRVNHVFTRLYLQPVLAGLRAYAHQLTGLDDFHVFVDSRREGLLALEELTRLLARVGLQPNFSRTWLVETRRARREQALARLRWDHIRHRLASWAARAGLPVASWFGLENALFVHRRPSFLELAACPAVQEAFYRRLQQDDLYFGDRALLLLCLAWAPVRPGPKLRRFLQAAEARLGSPLYRIAWEGLEPSGGGAS